MKRAANGISIQRRPLGWVAMLSQVAAADGISMAINTVGVLGLWIFDERTSKAGNDSRVSV
jgi:hypothetical protein